MSRIPVLTARELIAALKRLGFIHTRTNGSHWRFEHPDGRKTTVPVHKGRDLPRGLVHKIVTEDLRLPAEEFVAAL